MRVERHYTVPLRGPPTIRAAAVPWGPRDCSKVHGADCGKTLYRRLGAGVMRRRRVTPPACHVCGSEGSYDLPRCCPAENCRVSLRAGSPVRRDNLSWTAHKQEGIWKIPGNWRVKFAWSWGFSGMKKPLCLHYMENQCRCVTKKDRRKIIPPAVYAVCYWTPSRCFKPSWST